MIIKCIPTYHPAAILREWSFRSIAVADLRRAARFRRGEPYPVNDWRFTIRPNFSQVEDTLKCLLEIAEATGIRISLDLETKHGHIDCCGLSWTPQDAICIPFMSWENKEGYWNEDQEYRIVYYLYKLLTHPNCYVLGQNILYDAQYIYHHWHFIPNVKQDTMISHHVAFCGLPKRLDFQASMYCDFYRQWKPDKESWKEGG